MLLQRFPRQQPLRRLAAQCSSCPKQQAPFRHQQLRQLHEVPRPPVQEFLQAQGTSEKKPISRQGFEIAWTQYQQWIINRLNRLTAGTPLEHLETHNVLVQAARNPDSAHIFNYASMAWNNHFFFQSLSAEENPEGPGEQLLNMIKNDFSSLDSLRQTFLATADAMFGPGFVWLVQARRPDSRSNASNLRILNTYLAGSPLPGAHWRKQEKDMNTQSPATLDGTLLSPGQQEFLNEQHTKVQNSVGSIGPHSQAAQTPQPAFAPGGADVTPLLCVNTWEHVWLRDYGVGGKMNFLEAWWDRINWREVESRANLAHQGSNQFYYPTLKP